MKRDGVALRRFDEVVDSRGSKSRRGGDTTLDARAGARRFETPGRGAVVVGRRPLACRLTTGIKRERAAVGCHFSWGDSLPAGYGVALPITWQALPILAIGRLAALSIAQRRRMRANGRAAADTGRWGKSGKTTPERHQF